jgi:RNA polymerase sigma-70 factor, ECF subfamily
MRDPENHLPGQSPGRQPRALSNDQVLSAECNDPSLRGNLVSRDPSPPPRPRMPHPLPNDRNADPEAALVAAARGGSTQALGELFAPHGRAVHATAYRLTGSVQDAEDVLQDVFVMLPDALQGYDERGRFIPWLKRVATLTALMRVRGRSRRREAGADELELMPTRAAPDPVDRLAARRALEALPDGLRTVWVLKEVEGYSHAEIGEMLGITSGNSAARLFRAWKLLRAALGEEG